MDMMNDIYERVRLEEGPVKLRSFFIYLYLRGCVPVKTLSLYLRLPIPVVSAIKNECKRFGLLAAAPGGVRLTDAGAQYVREDLHYGAVDIEKLTRVLDAPDLPVTLFENEIKKLEAIYAERPSVDVTVDQSLCTAETGIRRALMMLRIGGLFGQRLFFAGDDDLTSIAVGLIINSMCIERDADAVSMTAADIDGRVLHYISQVSEGMGLPVNCVQHDLRQPLPDTLTAQYDAVFTDPPYTVPGLGLFISRGVQALKNEPDLTLYLSHARKEPRARLDTQRMLTDAGLVITQIHERFNHYHGAQILGGTSDLTILNTTRETRPVVDGSFTSAMYTNETNPSTRVYICKQCRTAYRIGRTEDITTIERLKERRCEACGGDVFLLRERKTELSSHE